MFLTKKEIKIHIKYEYKVIKIKTKIGSCRLIISQRIRTDSVSVCMYISLLFSNVTAACNGCVVSCVSKPLIKSRQDLRENPLCLCSVKASFFVTFFLVYSYIIVSVLLYLSITVDVRRSRFTYLLPMTTRRIFEQLV